MLGNRIEYDEELSYLDARHDLYLRCYDRGISKGFEDPMRSVDAQTVTNMPAHSHFPCTSPSVVTIFFASVTLGVAAFGSFVVVVYQACGGHYYP
jgi:hypothetical protein